MSDRSVIEAYAIDPQDLAKLRRIAERLEVNERLTVEQRQDLGAEMRALLRNAHPIHP